MIKTMDSSIYWLLLDMRDLALDSATEATNARPHDANTWFRRGVIELLCECKTDAMASLAHAVRLDHTLMEAWAMLSALWAQFDKPVAAQVTARRVLAQRPDLAPVIARAAMQLSQHEAALEALDVIDAVTKTGYVTVELVREHGRLLGKMGFPEEAAKALRAIWSARPPETR